MKKAAALLGLILWIAVAAAGCRFVKIEEEPHRALKYSIVKREDVPREILAMIQEKKEKEFEFTYQSGKELFLVKGYGRQLCGGYRISVEELGCTSDAIYFHTKLLGPTKENAAFSTPSYPYIVVKMTYRKAPVIFE
ncbi:MAG: protease complex subunit PrcB family protein [Blautia sp.]